MLVIKGLNSNWNGSSGAAEGKRNRTAAAIAI